MSEYGRGSVRVNLRIPEDTHAVIKRIADYEGISVAQMVQRTVEGMRPQLDQITSTIDQGDAVQTVEEGVRVLDQLKAMSAHARSEADRLDAMIEAWQEQVREAGQEQKQRT